MSTESIKALLKIDPKSNLDNLDDICDIVDKVFSNKFEINPNY